MTKTKDLPVHQKLAILESLERLLDALTGKTTDENEIEITKMIASLRIGQLRAEVRTAQQVAA